MRKLLSAMLVPAALVAIACDGGTSTEPVVEHNFTFRQCGGSTAVPFWLAVKDGDGPWTRVVGQSGTFNFTINSDRAGIASYVGGGDGLSVIYATKAELEAHLPNCTESARTVTTVVSGYTTLDGVLFSIGDSLRQIESGLGTSEQLIIPAIRPSATDIVAARYRFSGTVQVNEFFPNNVALRRGVTGTSTPTVDFASTTEAGAPLQRTVTIAGRGVDDDLIVGSHVALKTTVGPIAQYAALAGQGSATPPFYGVPGSRLQAGESNLLVVRTRRVLNTEAGNGAEERYMAVSYTDPTDRTVNLGPALGTVAITTGARPSATYTIQAGYDNFFEAVFYQQLTGAQIYIGMTKGYLGNAAQVTLATPDLSGLAQFSSQWLITPGTKGEYVFRASNGDLSALFGSPRAWQFAFRAVPYNF